MSPAAVQHLADLIERHEVEWSWENLPAELQRKFATRLAVVVGPLVDPETWWSWMDIATRREWRWMAEHPTEEAHAYEADIERLRIEADEASCELFRQIIADATPTGASPTPGY